MIDSTGVEEAHPGGIIVVRKIDVCHFVCSIAKNISSLWKFAMKSITLIYKIMKKYQTKLSYSAEQLVNTSKVSKPQKTKRDWETNRPGD